jgi:hypothetical protein
MKRGDGSMFMLGLMFSVVIFIGGIVLLEPIKDITSSVRSDLSCGGSISTYIDMTCIIVGSFLPLFAIAVVGVALAVFKIRKIVNGE